jgi:hypothetical protein
MLGFSQGLADSQIAGLLTGTGYVLTRVQVADEGGGRKVTYTKGDAFECALAPLKGGEYTGARAMPKPAGDRLDARTTHVISIPAGTEVDERDQIEVEGHGVFEVTALRRRSTEIAREVEAREAP